MSYDVSFDKKSGGPVILGQKHELSGGICALGGTDEAWLNITYNYSSHYYKIMPNGIYSLQGKSLEQIITILETAINKLSPETETDNYWDGTEGNARLALVNLLALAKIVMAADPEATIKIR
jgi:hypothetical protein